MTLRMATGDASTLEWTTSSHSSNDGPQCVEVAAAPGTVHVRDSKDRTRPGLTVSTPGWTAFTTYAATEGHPSTT